MMTLWLQFCIIKYVLSEWSLFLSLSLSLSDQRYIISLAHSISVLSVGRPCSSAKSVVGTTGHHQSPIIETPEEYLQQLIFSLSQTETIWRLKVTFLCFIVFVLGREEGYTVKYTPFAWRSSRNWEVLVQFINMLNGRLAGGDYRRRRHLRVTVPKGKAQGNSWRRRGIFDRISRVESYHFNNYLANNSLINLIDN